MRSRPVSLIAGTVLVLVVFGAVVAAPLLAGADPNSLSTTRLAAPSFDHLMGTDDLGRDVFARVLHGGRVSLLVGLVAAAISVLVGMSVGMAAGFLGGRVDDALMRFAEVFQILPRLFVAILVVALFGSSLFNVILVIGFLSWAGTARIIRSAVMVIRNEDFITATRMSGASHLRLMTRHLLPNVLPYLLVTASLQVATAILSESYLSFLGLGDPQKPGWGLLLQQGQVFLREAWWLTTFPGIALAATILGLNLIGDRASVQPKV